MSVDRRVSPEDCPTPGYHETFRYCPSCTWTDPTPMGASSPLRLHVAEDWPSREGARYRRVGWLDQKGRVWLELPTPASKFDGGSLTPLLIDVGDD